MRDANPPKRWGYRGRGRFHHGLLRTDRGSIEFDRDSMDEVQNGIEDGGEPDENGHVRFASAPEVGRVKEIQLDGIQLNGEYPLERPVRALENGVDHGLASEAGQLRLDEHTNGVSGELQTKHETESKGSSSSDGAPNASMEVQSHSADTTLTLADVTVTNTVSAESIPQELRSEPDSQTVISTPPQSNPDAASVYAPSSAGGSAPPNNGYYAQTPSWIPPYAMPPASYSPYGYYPQQVAGQPATDGSNPYPWMAALYRVNLFPSAIMHVSYTL